MKPRSFQYVHPTSLAEALDVLRRHGDDAKVLAGGQSLVPAMNMRFAAPEVVVDLGGLDELRAIEVTAGTLRIGALATHAEIASSPVVAGAAPLLALAAPSIAHATIRNRGTFGGSLVNADPAAEWPACALVLDARFNISGPDGGRQVGSDAFIEGTYTSCLAADEILTSVDVPVTTSGRCFFDEVARRRGDYAMAGIAAVTTGDGLAGLRVAFFGVSDRPVLAEELMARAADGALADDDAIGAAATEGIDILDDLHTSAAAKAHLMRVLARRAVAFFRQGDAA